jgi:hypothetical protein
MEIAREVSVNLSRKKKHLSDTALSIEHKKRKKV